MKLLTTVSFICFFFFHVQVSAQSTITYSISTFDQTKLTGLSLACNGIYNANITSCTAQDFMPTVPCSSACIGNLNSLQAAVQSSCLAGSAPATSLLSLFISGQGAQDLCATRKLAATTLVTSAASATATGTKAAVPTVSPVMIQGGDSTIVLSHGTVVAIVVAVLVASAVLVVIGTILYRKNYTEKK